MHSCKLLAHTADMKFFLRASSFVELFQAGLEALAITLGGEEVKNSSEWTLTEEVSLEAPDATALLVDFLGEVLVLSYQKKILFLKVKFSRLSEREAVGRIYGRRVQEFKDEVKAVTYHQAEIRKIKDNLFETIIVFDV
jgi:SHS2 domain-containing protein